MKVEQSTNTPLEQSSHTNPTQKELEQTQDFSALLDDEITVQNGGGGHPDKKKTES